MQMKQLLIAAILGMATSVATAAEMKTVALTYIVDQPAINAARDGIVAALGAAGYVDGKTMELIVQGAQGSMPTQIQIAKEFAGDSPDLMIAISTPSAQALQSAAGTTPVVFAAVTDPVGAKLVASLDRPGANITGVTDMQSLKPTLDLIKSVVPSARRLGVIYNAGEANSVSQVKALKEIAASSGMQVVESTASQSAMVGDAARSLIGRVDVILLPTDSTVVSAVESVVAVGEQSKTPVFASDTASVTRGAVAALGFNYYDIGKLSGDMAAKILAGASPSSIPVGALKTQDLYLNAKSGAAMGITIPPAVMAAAVKVYE
jgi:putative tryptophan/tyrosine transport system substrate-binding protein